MSCPKCNRREVIYNKDEVLDNEYIYYWVCWTSAEHHYYKVSYIKYCPFCGYKLKDKIKS